MQRHPVKPISKPRVYHIELPSAQAGRKPVAEVSQGREEVLQSLKPTTLPSNTEINLLLTPRRKGKSPFCYSWAIPWRREERG